MALADEISESRSSLYRSKRTAICTMRLVLDYLNEEDRVALQELMDDRRVYGVAIGDLLRGWGPKVAEAATEAKDSRRRHELVHLSQLCGGIGDGTIQRHRRGKCTCGEGT